MYIFIYLFLSTNWQLYVDILNFSLQVRNYNHTVTQNIIKNKTQYELSGN